MQKYSVNFPFIGFRDRIRCIIISLSSGPPQHMQARRGAVRGAVRGHDPARADAGPPEVHVPPPQGQLRTLP